MSQLRSPICTIIGNVNSGKSMLLDILRSSHIVDTEAGGITQRVGVTQLTKEKIVELTQSINKEIIVPGIMFIDTPGHECFSQQRISGVQISDLVIIVVDVLKGLEKQTIECLKLLKKTKTPFLIAVNKIDRINEWNNNSTTIESLKSQFSKQDKIVTNMLDDYLNKIVVQVAENGMNAAVYYKNTNMKEFISMVPVSAKFGYGIPDLLVLINMLSAKFLQKILTIKEDCNDGFIVEKIKDYYHGDIITVILTNGKVEADDTLLTFSKYNDIFESKIKQVLVPFDNKEVKDKFNLTVVSKVTAPKLAVLKLVNMNVRTGVKFFSTHTDNNKSQYNNIKQILNTELASLATIVDNNSKNFKAIGIYINAQTSGMAEALYAMCETEHIDVAGIHIGPVTKMHLMKAETVLSNLPCNDEDDKIFNKRFSTVLAFGVDVPKKLPPTVTVVQDDVIYKLLDKYKQFVIDLDNTIRNRHPNIIPKCEMKILNNHVYMRKNPLIFGVTITTNKLKQNNIIECINKKKVLILGEVTSIQKNKKPLTEAQPGDEVCIKIDATNYQKYEYGKDFDDTNILQTHFREEDKKIMMKFRAIFNEKN